MCDICRTVIYRVGCTVMEAYMNSVTRKVKNTVYCTDNDDDNDDDHDGDDNDDSDE
jgi:hypothetical protein